MRANDQIKFSREDSILLEKHVRLGTPGEMGLRQTYPHAGPDALERVSSQYLPGPEADLICYKVHIRVPRELGAENKLFCILCLA